MDRLLKQVLFGGLYLAIAVGAVWLVYRAVVPAPQCNDGIMNGQEEGVDCGAVCGIACPAPILPLQHDRPQFLENSDGSWDVLVRLENPNAAYGAFRVEYRLIATSDDGGVLATRRGDTYVNPLRPRVLVFPLGAIGVFPASASFVIEDDDVSWAALDIDAAGAVQFAVRNETLSDRGADGFQYEALALNRSRFDFDEVNVTVLLRDATGATVGAGSTIIRTMRAGEERAFVIGWPFAVPDVADAQVFIGTNVFENDNYIRAYGSQERFQGF